MRPARWLAALVAALALATGGVSTAMAKATPTDSITATVQGTATTTPTNGKLIIYDNVTYFHHTRTITYYQHDDYNKTENLVSASRPIGVVLRKEYIENACDSNPTDASVNPVGGYEIPCGGNLVATDPGLFPLGGDLVGRFCRKAQLPDTSPADCLADPIHVSENAVGGLGQYVEVGNKDHGGMTEIDYYANVAGQDHNVNVTLPKVAATDYNGVQRMIQPLVIEVVLEPQLGSAPTAVLVLQ